MTDAERILAAARDGDEVAVRELLARDPALVGTVDAHRKTPLHLAAEHDHAGVAELLLEDGAVSAAFVLACRNGHTDVAQFLLGRGADVNARGFLSAPALHWAAINGHADTVAFLLGEGADPTLHDAQFGSDAVGWAREGGHEAVVALLDSAAMQ